MGAMAPKQGWYSISVHFLLPERKRSDFFLFSFDGRSIRQGQASTRGAGGWVAAGAVVPEEPGLVLLLKAVAAVVVGSPQGSGRRRAQGRTVREDQHGRRADRAESGPHRVRRLRRPLRRRRQALPRPARRYLRVSSLQEQRRRAVHVAICLLVRRLIISFFDRAAQRDPAATAGGEAAAEEEVQEPVIGGDYTLVYEDDEGDRVLVGDVPWE